MITSGTKSTFELFDETIEVSLDLEYPCRIDDIHVLGLIYNLPGSHGIQGLNFSDSSFPKFLSKLAINGLPPVWVVLLAK